VSSAAEERTTGSVPVVSWEELWLGGAGPDGGREPLLQWEPGEHVSYIGTTGSGKTTAIVSLLEMTPQHAVLIVTKNRDKLVTRLPSERGWQLAREPEDVFRLMGKLTPRDREWWEGQRERPPQRIVYWPKLPAGTSLEERGELLRWRVSAILDRAYERGDVTVAIDETTFASEELGLRRSLNQFWNEGRSSGISILAGMQRPALVPKVSRSQATYLGIFRTPEPDDQRALAEMAGFADRATLRKEIDSLPRFHHLLVNTRTGDMYVTRVVIRKKRAAGGRGARAG